MDFYKAYHFLKHHEKGCFMNALDIEVVKVNPAKNEIDDDRPQNTQVKIWLETGPKIGTHDYALDCGGNTFEEAIIRLAELFRFYYDENDRDYHDDLIPYITRL